MSDISFISSTEPSFFPTLQLPPVPTLAELIMEIIQLENEFDALYLLLPDYPTDQQLVDFYKMRETKESYLKQKRVYMQEVRVDLEFPSPPLSLSPLLILPISHAHAHHSHPSHNEQSPNISQYHNTSHPLHRPSTRPFPHETTNHAANILQSPWLQRPSIPTSQWHLLPLQWHRTRMH